MVFLEGKGRLEDRVFRIETEDSYASMPLIVLYMSLVILLLMRQIISQFTHLPTRLFIVMEGTEHKQPGVYTNTFCLISRVV